MENGLLKETIVVNRGDVLPISDTFIFEDGRMLKGVTQYVIKDIVDDNIFINIYYAYESSIKLEFENDYKRLKENIE